MPIHKGGITSVGTHGWWKSEATPCDYPDEADVEAGVEFDNGSKTGTFVGVTHLLEFEVESPEVSFEVE